MAEIKKEPVSDTPAPEMVTMPKDTLQRILDQLDRNDESIKILTEAASQGKILEAQNRRKPEEKPKAYLKVFMGKIVVGWKTEKAETIYHPTNPNVPVGEILKSRYTFADGSESEPTDQVLFTRCEDRVVVRLQNTKEELRNPYLKDLKVTFEELITNDENLKASFVMPKGEATVNINFINP